MAHEYTSDEPAEKAAALVVAEFELFQYEGESALQALSRALGEVVEYESTLGAFASAVAKIARGEA